MGIVLNPCHGRAMFVVAQGHGPVFEYCLHGVKEEGCFEAFGSIARGRTQKDTEKFGAPSRMADDTFTNRRGIGGETPKQVSPSDEAVDAFGPVLMEGPAKRQGEGWKGMKPWNDRFAAVQASARASSLRLLRLTSPAPCPRARLAAGLAAGFWCCDRRRYCATQRASRGRPRASGSSSRSRDSACSCTARPRTSRSRGAFAHAPAVLGCAQELTLWRNVVRMRRLQLEFAASDKKMSGCCIEMSSAGDDGAPSECAAFWLFAEKSDRDGYSA